jgi:hypothetical protein
MTERQKYHYTEIIMQVSITGRKMVQFQKANYKLYIEFKPSQLTISMFSPTIVISPHKKLPGFYGTLEQKPANVPIYIPDHLKSIHYHLSS